MKYIGQCLDLISSLILLIFVINEIRGFPCSRKADEDCEDQNIAEEALSRKNLSTQFESYILSIENGTSDNGQESVRLGRQEVQIGQVQPDVNTALPAAPTEPPSFGQVVATSLLDIAVSSFTGDFDKFFKGTLRILTNPGAQGFLNNTQGFFKNITSKVRQTVFGVTTTTTTTTTTTPLPIVPEQSDPYTQEQGQFANSQLQQGVGSLDLGNFVSAIPGQQIYIVVSPQAEGTQQVSQSQQNYEQPLNNNGVNYNNQNYAIV